MNNHSSQAKLISELSKKLESRFESEGIKAAVCIILRLPNDNMEILLVKRAERPGDPWSGQVALPGGKRLPEDGDLMHTVMREVFEETRINLSESARFLGVMKPVKSIIQPTLRVAPFIFMLLHGTSIKLQEELHSYRWVSINDIIKNKGALHAGSRREESYNLPSYVVWGLTYRILKGFLEIVRSLAGEGINLHNE